MHAAALFPACAALWLIAQVATVDAALLHRPISSFPTDPHASPRFQVNFLNNLPIGIEEAEIWLAGLSRDQSSSKGEVARSNAQSSHNRLDNHEASKLDWSELFSGKMSLKRTGEMDAEFIARLLSDADYRTLRGLDRESFPRLVKTKMAASFVDREEYPLLSRTKYTNSSNEHQAKEFLCALPPVEIVRPALNKDDGQAKGDQAETEDIPLDVLAVYHSLNDLTKNCLYHRQGWFTYIYCHNSHIRQFREVVQPANIVPKEDENFEAYDLGLSPLYLEERLEEYRVLLEQAEQDGLHARSVAPKKVGEIPDITLELVPALQVQVEQLEGILARLERHANPNMISADDKQTEAEDFIRQTVSIHSNAQAKYLVEVWEGGTICDMTSKARKIEIEFHCGADGADEIVGVKEIATCQYIMTIKTPRLCNIPGFYVPSAHAGPLHEIRCRRIVPETDIEAVLSGQGAQAYYSRSGRVPQGWYSSHREAGRDYLPKRTEPKAAVGPASDIDSEVIIPQFNGQPPERIVKPPKARKKQKRAKNGKADAQVPADEVIAKGKEKEAEIKRETKKTKGVDRKPISSAKKPTSPLPASQLVRQRMNEHWDNLGWVRMARWVGYYKKGEERETNHRRRYWADQEERLKQLEAQEERNRKARPL